MKTRVRYIWKIITVIGVISFSQIFAIHANEPDSTSIFAYTNEQIDGRGGINFARNIDGDSWNPIGVGYPHRVNGEKAAFCDTYANDQDRAMAYFLLVYHQL